MLFWNRSYEKELLDSDQIATGDLFLNLIELDSINKRSGGYTASIKGLKYILKTKKNVSAILDIGFGGGDSIKKLSEFSDKNNAGLFFYGVGLKDDCVSYAEDNLSCLGNKKLFCDDYKNV